MHGDEKVNREDRGTIKKISTIKPVISMDGRNLPLRFSPGHRHKNLIPKGAKAT
jgi:hypothetical protein